MLAFAGVTKIFFSIFSSFNILRQHPQAKKIITSILTIIDINQIENLERWSCKKQTFLKRVW